MNTMDDLKQNKQNAKLAVFKRLYALLLLSVLISTVTLIGFSYIVNHANNKPIWQYQWLQVYQKDLTSSMNEGIWSIYYFILFLCLMIMWKPSENSSEYAYHIQVATNADDVEIMKRKS